MPILYVETGADAGKKFDVKETATIGRLATNQVKIGDAEASREHTRLVQEADGWYAIDLGSRNGTLVNGKKVSKQKLAHGDRITIGKTVIRVEDPDAYQAMGRQPPTVRTRAGVGAVQVSGEPVKPSPPAPQRPQFVPTPVPRTPMPPAQLQPPVIPYPQQPPPQEPKPQPYYQAPAPPAVPPQGNVAQPAPPPDIPVPPSSRLHAVSGTRKLLVVMFFIVFFIVLFLAARWVGLKVTDSMMENTKAQEQGQQ